MHDLARMGDFIDRDGGWWVCLLRNVWFLWTLFLLCFVSCRAVVTRGSVCCGEIYVGLVEPGCECYER